MKDSVQSQPPLASEALLKQARLLAGRLEKITPDSSWAHRASGHRRVLLRYLRLFDRGQVFPDGIAKERQLLEAALISGFAILERAAQERLKKSSRSEDLSLKIKTRSDPGSEDKC